MQHCNLHVENKEIPFLIRCSCPYHQELPSAAFSFEAFLFRYLQTLQLLVTDSPEKETAIKKNISLFQCSSPERKWWWLMLTEESVAYSQQQGIGGLLLTQTSICFVTQPSRRKDCVTSEKRKCLTGGKGYLMKSNCVGTENEWWGCVNVYRFYVLPW